MRARFFVFGLTTFLLPAGIIALPALADWPTFGRALCTAPGNQIGPVIATDGAGGAIVAWRDLRAFPFNIDAQHVLGTGTVDAAWPVNGRALLSDSLIATIVPQGVESPAIASDGAGGVIVTWPDGRSTLNGEDIYAQHILASGAVDPAWPANGTTVCSVVGDQAAPAILADGAGGAFITWMDGRAGTAASDIDLFAQHVLASGGVDPAWPANGTPICTAPKIQSEPQLVADGLGGFIVAWNDLRTGNPGSDIFAEHVFRSGVVDPAWPLNGRDLSPAPGSQTTPQITSDGSNGAIVAWTDTRDGNDDIYAQRVTVSGAIAPGWPVSGQPIAVSPFAEVTPTLVSDGAGGAILAWQDDHSGVLTMRAAHVLANSTRDPAWPAGGVPLSFSDCEENNQVMVSDGAGGAIVAWQRCFDIFAQHVLASGALDPEYPASGRAVCSLPGSLQHEPDIVAAGAGGAIVTWQDTRDGLNDIYALQILAAATLGVPGPTTPPAIAFAPPSPNPARGPVRLRFTLPRDAATSLAIYDASGRQMRDLGSGTQTAGEHVIAWDLRDEIGRVVPAGLYFARLKTQGHELTQRILALR